MRGFQRVRISSKRLAGSSHLVDFAGVPTFAAFQAATQVGVDPIDLAGGSRKTPPDTTINGRECYVRILDESSRQDNSRYEHWLDPLGTYRRRPWPEKDYNLPQRPDTRIT